jgi:transglutaminase-like putative cysteine protease
MHYAIRYMSEYKYDAPVTDNLNALRVKPATTSSQRCDEFHTRIEPEARVSRHLDYFGTEVLEFGIPTSHSQLAIDVRTRVVTSEPARPESGGWESLRSAAYEDAAGEFALPWQDQPAIVGLEELQGAMRTDGPLQTLESLCELIPDRFEYRPGATYVGSSVSDLLRVGAGVCQDYVHLALILLRRAGIAARYVSGYLWAAPEDEGEESVEVDTHAWLEALLPSTDGRGEPVWVGADPTNRRLAGETHVKIGHGRFYADVAPVKGLYLGGATSELTAAVTMSRLDPQAGAKA